eukprot:3057734-Pleurochrysis_carterae.AAC.1
MRLGLTNLDETVADAWHAHLRLVLMQLAEADGAAGEAIAGGAAGGSAGARVPGENDSGSAEPQGNHIVSKPRSVKSASISAALEQIRSAYELGVQMRNVLPRLPHRQMRLGLSFASIWLEKIDCDVTSGCNSLGDHVVLELVAEAEGLWGGSVLKPVYSRSGERYSRDLPAYEESSTAACALTSESVHWWHQWRTPALLTGWQAVVVLLKHHRWDQRSARAQLVGWAHMRLEGLKSMQSFHLHMWAPPVATRLRDLDKGRHLDAWAHGQVMLGIHGVPRQQRAAQ